MDYMPASNTLNGQRTPDLVQEAAVHEAAEVLGMLGTTATGLTEAEVTARLEKYGPNQVGREKKQGWLERFYLTARNPLVILLTILAVISFVAPEGDARAGIMMLLMVVLGLSLRFVQETKA
jgi:Mg2+-importing ATPase